MEDLEKLIQLCIKLGATPQQAQRMSQQMLKRSEQISLERGISQVEALDHLLRILIQGREGHADVELP